MYKCQSWVKPLIILYIYFWPTCLIRLEDVFMLSSSITSMSMNSIYWFLWKHFIHHRSVSLGDSVLLVYNYWFSYNNDQINYRACYAQLKPFVPQTPLLWFSHTYQRAAIQGANTIMAQRPMKKWGHSKNVQKKKIINITNGYNKNRKQKGKGVFSFLLSPLFSSVGVAWLCCDGTSHYQDAREEDLNFKECFKSPFPSQWK